MASLGEFRASQCNLSAGSGIAPQRCHAPLSSRTRSNGAIQERGESQRAHGGCDHSLIASQLICRCIIVPGLHRHPVACLKAHAQTLLLVQCTCLLTQDRVAIVIRGHQCLSISRGLEISRDHEECALIQTSFKYG